MLKNKIILLTGCSRGIGNAMMHLFLKRGAIVYANAREEGCLDSVEKEYIENMIPLYFDVRNKEKCKEAVMRIKREQGRIDVLVNNAGIMKDANMGMIDDDTLANTFETNVFAVINLTQYVARLMKRQRTGCIINMSSVVGTGGNAGQTVYSATKGAVATLTKTWAKELAKDGIRVNAIAPGKIDTDMYRSIGEEKVEEGIKEIGFGRLGTPEEVANVAVFLASDLSTYITGEIIGVNGGLFI